MIHDLLDALHRWDAWVQFAINDIRLRFRRSILGPLWITLSTAIMILTMGVVFSTVFSQDVSRTLPYITIGVVFWNFISASICESSATFIEASSFIKNVPAPLFLHLFRVLARNAIILFFNFAIILVVLVIFSSFQLRSLLFLPGLFLIFINLLWIGIFVSIASARFRDISQMVINLVQVLFFFTPVFWSVDHLPTRPVFVTWNPLYHLIEGVRAPLLSGEMPTVSWFIGLAFCVFGFSLTIGMFRNAYKRVPYWL